MSRILRQTTDYVPPATAPTSDLVFSPGPSTWPGMSPLDRLLQNEVNDPGSSLAFPLASPLGFQPASILFNWTTVPVGDKQNVYNAPFQRLSAGFPLQEGSFVIDVVFPQGQVNKGSSYMVLYTVSGGVLT